jgi:hypothetical protein
MSKIQGKSVKNSTDIVSGGGAISDLITDDQLYISANSINKTLKQSVIDGDIGAGGACSLVWKKTGITSPNTRFVDGFELLDFAYDVSQEIYCTFIVPSSYSAGKQIQLKNAAFFTTATTNKVFFKSQSTLIRAASTVLGTYSNQRTSTNAEVTVSGTTNQLKAVGSLDLTSSTGQINAVSVAAGDIIRVRIYRDIAAESASAAADAGLVIDAIELTLK